MDQDIAITLQDYVAKTFLGKGDVEIHNLKAINQGWESVIYAFDMAPRGNLQHGNLILRIYPGVDAYQKSLREFIGMQRLYQVGYPVPIVYSLERDDSPFGKPFIIMERIEGEMLWPVLDRSSLEVATVLVTKMCALLVQLHSLNWREFVPEEEQSNLEDPYASIDHFLSSLLAMTEPFPILKAFLPVFEWLKTWRDSVPCTRPAPVHWDFHPGNLILQPDGNLKVIDWTQIQVSDPRFDLGWTLLLAGAYSEEDILRNHILGGYQRLSGNHVEQLEYFDVANAVKRLGSVMISLSAGAEKMGMRSDAIAAMRRDFHALKWVYNLMRTRTGIVLPEVERFLEIE
jgi:aminoglycoside phosphotransferase (APT) family kinase protein